MEIGELWLGVMGMVLLGVLLGNRFGLVMAVLPVVGMLACEFTSGLTAVGLTGYDKARKKINKYLHSKLLTAEVQNIIFDYLDRKKNI